MIRRMKKIWLQYKKMPLEVKSGFWFVICSLLQKGITSITTPIFTRLLSTEDYGIYNLYNSWYSILRIIVTMNLASGVFNNAMIKYKNLRDRYVSALEGLSVLLAIVWFAIYYFTQNLWINIIGLPTIIMFFMFLEFAITPAREFYTVRMRFEYKYKSVIAISLLGGLATPLISIGAILVSQNRGYARIYSIIAVSVTISAFIFAHNLRKGKCLYDKEMWSYSLKFNVALVPHFLSSVLLSSSDVIMINYFCTTSQAGIYGVGRGLAYMFNMIKSSLIQTLTPWMYKEIEKKRSVGLKRNINLMLLVFGFFVICLSLIAPEVIWIFAARDYREAMYVVPPLACSVFLQFAADIFINFQLYFEKTNYISTTSIVISIVNIILNIAFLKLFNYQAAAYTTLASYLLYFVMHYRKMKKIELTHFGERVFNSCIIWLTLLGTLALSIGSILLYSHIFFRYFIIAVILGIAFIKRNQIIDLFKMGK
ncbi:MAG: oligosaccharide flippase family protein [Lachnospiraceae bacterium]|nr:oligosaccharide flippase family protein [Lachnospiraceae bacterium]